MSDSSSSDGSSSVGSASFGSFGVSGPEASSTGTNYGTFGGATPSFGSSYGSSAFSSAGSSIIGSSAIGYSSPSDHLNIFHPNFGQGTFGKFGLQGPQPSTFGTTYGSFGGAMASWGSGYGSSALGGPPISASIDYAMPGLSFGDQVRASVDRDTARSLRGLSIYDPPTQIWGPGQSFLRAPQPSSPLDAVGRAAAAVDKAMNFWDKFNEHFGFAEPGAAPKPSYPGLSYGFK